MAWYNASWPKRFLITSNQLVIDEAIDNVFYDLANAPAGFWVDVLSDGGDIRVTQGDETTEVAREVAAFDQGGTVGSLFFTATGLSTSVDTNFYVYYGNSGATEPAAGSTYGKNNVWTSCLAVFHMDDASTSAVDSKAAITATGSGGLSYAATGKLRTGIDVGGVDGRLTAGNVLGITAASLTFSGWLKPDTLGENNQGRILVKNTTATAFAGYQWSFDTTNRMRLQIGDAAATSLANSSNNAITLSVLQYAVVTYDGANARFYVNAATQGAPALTRVPSNGGQNFCMGNNVSDTARTYDGVLDEIRISTSVRSANWITTEYNNQNAPGTFWTTGAAESLTVAARATHLATLGVS